MPNNWVFTKLPARTDLPGYLGRYLLRNLVANILRHLTTLLPGYLLGCIVRNLLTLHFWHLVTFLVGHVDRYLDTVLLGYLVAHFLWLFDRHIVAFFPWYHMTLLSLMPVASAHLMTYLVICCATQWLIRCFIGLLTHCLIFCMTGWVFPGAVVCYATNLTVDCLTLLPVDCLILCLKTSMTSPLILCVALCVILCLMSVWQLPDRGLADKLAIMLTMITPVRDILAATGLNVSPSTPIFIAHRTCHKMSQPIP